MRKFWENKGIQTGSGRINASNIEFSVSGNNVHSVIGNQGNFIVDSSNIAEAALEIQQLLEKLSETHPSNTTSGRMQIAVEAIAQIESNPSLRQRIIISLKAGGIVALAQILNHPAAGFVIGALEDWQKDKNI